MLPKMNEEYADFVLSISQNGLYDMVTELTMDDNKHLVANLQPDLIEKFARKFPEVSLIELDNAVHWILLKSRLINAEQLNELKN